MHKKRKGRGFNLTFSSETNIQRMKAIQNNTCDSPIPELKQNKKK